MDYDVVGVGNPVAENDAGGEAHAADEHQHGEARADGEHNHGLLRVLGRTAGVDLLDDGGLADKEHSDEGDDVADHGEARNIPGEGVEHALRQGGEALDGARLEEGENADRHDADQNQDALYQVSVGDAFEAAEEGGEDEDHYGENHSRRVREPDVSAQQGGEGGYHGAEHGEVAYHYEYGGDDAGLGVIAHGKNLCHRVEVELLNARGYLEAHKQQRKAAADAHPAPLDAELVIVANIAHERAAADKRGYHGAGGHVPGQGLAAERVVLQISLCSTADKGHQANRKQKVERDDNCRQIVHICHFLNSFGRA